MTALLWFAKIKNSKKVTRKYDDAIADQQDIDELVPFFSYFHEVYEKQLPL